MPNLLPSLVAGLLGALVGLIGVAVGNWIQGRKEHERWLRDQKLQAAIEFIGATGDLHQRGDELRAAGTSPIDERAVLEGTKNGRSALYLLCDADTMATRSRLQMI